jgi:hypothetical protein
MDYKPIAGAAIGIGAVGLMANATQMIPKYKKGKFQPIKTKKLVKGGVDLLVGTALLSGAASALK